MDANFLINYPMLDLGMFDGGFLIAFIGILHVYIAHFAIGGGLFLFMVERKAYRENSVPLLEYVKRHSRFFLLLSVVLGALTGVGIWFTISVISPDATSKLIHFFVFAWGIEWAFFLVEIVSIIIYVHTFHSMDKNRHLAVIFIYFVFGWLSLFAINGIISFMLTPGKWPETLNFWHGFFNPSFLPSLFFRTFLSITLAGIFGYITSLYIGDEKTRLRMHRYCSWWVILPLLFIVLSAIWCVIALPEPQKTSLLYRYTHLSSFFKTFWAITPILLVVGIVMSIRIKPEFKKAITILVVILGFMYIGSFEWLREAARRPYLIHGVLYSNGIHTKDLDSLDGGILQKIRWSKHKEITDENRLAAGKELYLFFCSSCHTENGIMKDMKTFTAKMDAFSIESMIDGMGLFYRFMPPFPGNRAERNALAAYIATGINQKKEEEKKAVSVEPLPVDVPEFDPGKDEYVLLAFSDKGMKFVSDNNRFFCLSPPANAVYAQLIKRGPVPEIVTADVVLTYELQEGFRKPSEQIDFWKYVPTLFGEDIPEDVGITGKETSGVMKLKEDLQAYIARGIPVVPYKTGEGFNPYPLMNIEARDAKGKLLGTTKVTAPATTELGCKNCHAGDWGYQGVTGISDKTAQDILEHHDKANDTDLLENAKQGFPLYCKGCHSDYDDEAGHVLNMSAAIHGFHANYLTDRYTDACTACHPSSSQNITQCQRDLHKRFYIQCINCHGKMEDHALSLLVAEAKNNKLGAKRLMKNIKPRSVDSVQKIHPRKPWINEPDCLNCHIDFNPPETDTVELNQWTKARKDLYRLRTDNAGVMCASCHGANHAIYPAHNPYKNDRDNIPPMQYQKNPYPIGANKNCKICHTIDMEEEFHHPNSLTMFRNVR